MTREQLEALFLANLPAIEKALAILSRLNGLSREHAEEFRSSAMERLIANDYAVLGKFRGESQLMTYVTSVLSMHLREHRVHELGRWRPSAEAKRQGELGIRLETMLFRDGLALAEAGELLRTAGLTTKTDVELAALAKKFPRRTPLRPVAYGDLPAAAESADRADQTVEAEEIETEATLLMRALKNAIASLPEDDRLIVRLHYMEGLTVARISRSLQLDQKRLYRQIEGILETLEAHLRQAGISEERIRDLLDDLP